MPLPSNKAVPSEVTASFATTHSSNNNEVAVNAVFGVLAVIASVVTFWQGKRFWKLWKKHHLSNTSRNQDNGPSIELEHRGSRSPPSSTSPGDHASITHSSVFPAPEGPPPPYAN
ncbi:MAG: hypothetical protein Q9190_006913 [Brigantiaea leucoxantha]